MTARFRAFWVGLGFGFGLAVALLQVTPAIAATSGRAAGFSNLGQSKQTDSEMPARIHHEGFTPDEIDVAESSEEADHWHGIWVNAGFDWSYRAFSVEVSDITKHGQLFGLRVDSPVNQSIYLGHNGSKGSGHLTGLPIEALIGVETQVRPRFFADVSFGIGVLTGATLKREDPTGVGESDPFKGLVMSLRAEGIFVLSDTFQTGVELGFRRITRSIISLGQDTASLDVRAFAFGMTVGARF